MATINIEEIQRFLHSKGDKDALPYQNNGEGYFLEIRFDKPNVKDRKYLDEEFKNKVFSVDCAYGSVLILFDENGLLKSIEIS
ncbi:hypothetical protein WJT86_12025 [Microvirga sp. W0021]|uniref:Uncharacterized protein n=1 Tax=Hohaiivirga grylli TaxID=3133970 RepID=A0ABV0BN84_9HYPH